MVTSDMLVTVSVGYAAEILTPDKGMGLHSLLQQRAGGLRGIVNGIDSDVRTHCLLPRARLCAAPNAQSQAHHPAPICTKTSAQLPSSLHLSGLAVRSLGVYTAYA